MPFNPPTVSTIARGTQALQIPRSVNDSEGGASPTLRPEHAGNIALAGGCRVRHRAGNDLPASPRVDETRARCLAVFRARGCLAPLPSPSSTRGADAWHRSHLARRRPASSGSHLRARRAHHTLPTFSGASSASVVRASRPHFSLHPLESTFPRSPTFFRLSFAHSLLRWPCAFAALRLCVETAMVRCDPCASAKSASHLRWCDGVPTAAKRDPRPITHPVPSAPHAPRSTPRSWR